MPAGTEGDTQLTQVVLKGLGDKLYDKRKAAALEVEQLIKNLSKEVSLLLPVLHQISLMKPFEMHSIILHCVGGEWTASAPKEAELRPGWRRRSGGQ